jgi:hypothetical protein
MGVTLRDRAGSVREVVVQVAEASYLAMVDQPGTRMARVAVRPNWVGLVDFQTRLPSNLGGITG